jgi:glutamate 5-kinase
MKNRKRVVIKIGTKVLTSQERLLDRERIRDIVGEAADLLDRGVEAVLVTSGAIGAGMGLLGLKHRPAELPLLQAAASVGQSHLMHVYSEYLKNRGYMTGQILLTQEDFNDRRRYLNIKYTLQSLIKSRAVPIINENDTISTDEIRCGDNDRLAALVSDLCEADLLVILTDVDGLMDEDGRVIPCVDDLSPRILRLSRASRCDLGTGGMATKLEAIKRATSSGISCVITNGKKRGNILKAVNGELSGTTFKCSGSKLIAKKRWIAFSSKAKGSIHVDAGAKEALVRRNKSLLASGVTAVSGSFRKGDVIAIIDKDSREIAKGVTNYSSAELAKIKGMKTGDFKTALGRESRDEVVHKDELAIL